MKVGDIRTQGTRVSSGAAPASEAPAAGSPQKLHPKLRSMRARTADATERVGTPKASTVTRIAAIAANNPDAEPMKHVEYLASPELLGRGSPSEGFDKASAYMVDLMKKYGMEGANAGDPSGNAFYQTFDLWSLRNGGDGAHLAKRGFGRDLFEGGFYLDDTVDSSEREIIRESCRAHGIGDYDDKKGLRDELTPDSLRRAGLEAQKVQNVMGIMRGTGPQKDEYIVLMAHLDHLGGTPQRFFPGASDNASGSGTNAALLPMLADLQKAGKLNRSVLVIWTAAEEKGLVGANYFIKHPVPGIPLTAIKGSINNDMIGRFEGDRMSVIDTTRGQKTFLTEAFEYAQKQLGDRKFNVVNRDINSFESRQDNQVFTRAGITTLFNFEGLTNPKGGGGENPDYHKPTDTVDKLLKDHNGEKLRRFRDLNLHMVEFASNAKL